MIEESPVVIGSDVIKKICEDEVDENILISTVKIGEDNEVPIYVVDVDDVDGKEKVMQEINFVAEKEIKETIVKDYDPIYDIEDEEEITFVDTDEIVENEVIFVKIKRNTKRLCRLQP